MGKQYRVVGPCALVPTTTQQGATIVTLYQGAVLPADTSEARIAHLLSVGLVEEFGSLDEPFPAGVDTPVQVATVGGQSVESVADPELLTKRSAAAAKLPADGSAPKNAHGEDVWMEYAVRKGMDRAEAERLGKAGLMRHYRDAGRNTKAAEGDDAELAALRKRAVEQGMDRAEVEKASADDLRALVK